MVKGFDMGNCRGHSRKRTIVLSLHKQNTGDTIFFFSFFIIPCVLLTINFLTYQTEERKNGKGGADMGHSGGPS